MAIAYIRTMQDKAYLKQALEESTATLSELIPSFTVDNFNRRPADGGWSGAQLAEHLLIFDKRLNMLLEHAIHPANRDPLEKLGAITAKVSNREEKIVAPPFLVPSENEQEPAAVLQEIIAERKKVLQKIDDQDMTLLNTKDPHRFYGDLTGMEWINLIVLHTQRHLPQFHTLQQPSNTN